jgi:hypothetical protein
MPIYTLTEAQLIALLTDAAEAALCQLGTMQRTPHVCDAIGTAVADTLEAYDQSTTPHRRCDQHRGSA